jgi:hypothetical protein
VPNQNKTKKNKKETKENKKKKTHFHPKNQLAQLPKS